MTLSDIIIPNEDFQSSVNIDYDFGSEAKVGSLVMTNSVSKYMEELLQEVMAPSRQRAKLLVGAYGKGKSHIVLATLQAMFNKGSKACEGLAEAMREKKLAFADSFGQFAKEGPRLLPVIVSGNSADLQRGMLHALRNSLRQTGLGDLMPSTNFDAAIEVIKRWGKRYPEAYAHFEEIVGESGKSMVSRLSKMDTDAYRLFVEAYPDLTAGSRFDELDGASAISIFEHVAKALKNEGFVGLYVVYDEFSKFLEASIADTDIGDIRFLQDFAELCNRSPQDAQIHLLLISHKSLENYIDAKLTKEKSDGWRGVSGRFKEVVMIDDFNQYYELIERAVVKDEKAWKKWLTAKRKKDLDRAFSRYEAQGLFLGADDARMAIGCYPLHPLTTYLLPRMSERLAQNERTLFTFLCGRGDGSLESILNDVSTYVMPDHVYDYFEPQLRKEFYTSPLHKIYELARGSLVRVEQGSLEARIIKTIAAIDVLSQYDRVAPTRATILELFKDDGFADREVLEAIEGLVDLQSIVYMRKSNSFLRLKESSGVNVDAEIAEGAESVKREKRSVDILNEAIRGRSLYPSRYNDEHRMVRYFACRFATLDAIGDESCDTESDGEIVALFPQSPDEIEACSKVAKAVTKDNVFRIVAIPKKYQSIDDALYRLEAAKRLKAEAADDIVLSEEYELVIEDLSEVTDQFVAMYFQPELGGIRYISEGEERKHIRRKHQLTEILSEICERAYPHTPFITSESLNKNELTGTAFSSRTKILKAICTSKDKGTFAFTGNGQETSMMRSALKMTGVLDGMPSKEMAIVFKEIDDFLDNASGESLSVIYDRLTSHEGGIGMRRGPIPIYLAWAIADRVDELKITHQGEERPLSETLLDDISKHPGEYEVRRVNWTPEMAEFTKRLSAVFQSDEEAGNRNGVVDSLRRWYISLPPVVRNTMIDHAKREGGVPISKERQSFFRTLRQIDMDTDTLLFERIPRDYGLSGVSKELVEIIAHEKAACDTYLEQAKSVLAKRLVELFEPDAPKEASLASVLHDWLDENPAAHSVVFDGVESSLIRAMMDANGDDSIVMTKLAKAATALRIDDWNDERFEDFISIVQDLKAAVEGASPEFADLAGRQTATIEFVDEGGEGRRRTFALVECDKRANILRRSILACLSEMGGALQPEEKRQVVFDILKELC